LLRLKTYSANWFNSYPKKLVHVNDTGGCDVILIESFLLAEFVWPSLLVICEFVIFV